MGVPVDLEAIRQRARAAWTQAVNDYAGDDNDAMYDLAAAAVVDSVLGVLAEVKDLRRRLLSEDLEQVGWLYRGRLFSEIVVEGESEPVYRRRVGG